MLAALRKLQPSVTARGMRSAFHDWVGEITHARGAVKWTSPTAEQAYAMGNLFQKRRAS
jgi:hypothetical protein